MTQQVAPTGDLRRIQEDLSQRPVTLQVKRMPVVDALNLLFRQVGGSFTVDGGVQGKVTATLSNVAFEVALQAITRQIDATYRVEGGVWEIVQRLDAIAVPPWAQLEDHLGWSKIGALRSDGTFLYALSEGVVYKLTKKDLQVVARAALK